MARGGDWRREGNLEYAGKARDRQHEAEQVSGGRSRHSEHRRGHGNGAGSRGVGGARRSAEFRDVRIAELRNRPDERDIRAFRKWNRRQVFQCTGLEVDNPDARRARSRMLARGGSAGLSHR